MPRDGERVEKVPLDRLTASPLQPRRNFAEEALEELKESIRQHGIIQPLIVREVGGRLELIAGERRFRASQLLGLTELPVIRRSATDRDVLEMALIENLQREDLDPVEEARGYERLAREFSLRQEDIAARVGKNRATVANAIRLLDLDEMVQGYLARGLITTGHAKAILAIKEAEHQRAVAEQVIKRKLTVRQTEALVVEQLDKTGGQKRSRKSGGTRVLPAHLADIESRLREKFSTQVQLIHSDKRGRIEIEYYGDGDLDRILEALGMVEPIP
ncbi:MAG: ParB/RepB/Spo0J family partition protein [Verrucomicrobiales bacterium]